MALEQARKYVVQEERGFVVEGARRLLPLRAL